MKPFSIKYLLLTALACVLCACANIGSPSGGPRDYTPPQVLKSSPEMGAVNFKGKKVVIQFDEIVNLKDQMKKVVISPTQKEPASVKALGKSVEVEFNDPLLPNTTYTIDFTDAIEDNNEGNRLDGYCFTFSTGEEIDTLAVSGMVLRARDLEPMQYVMVGLQSNLADSAFTTTKFDRICRTNDKGEFTVRGVKPGSYHIFALNDMDGNYMMARSEDYAFLDEVIVPSVRHFESQDTTFTFDHRVDTVMTGSHAEYLPNDILLSMFNERYTPLYLKKTERQGRSKLFVQFSAPTQLPTLRIVSPEAHAQDWCVLERREGNDSLIYWITDSTLIKADSIVVDMTYQKLDSTSALVEANDTVVFAARVTNAELKKKAEEKKEREEREKSMAKLLERREKLVAQGKETTDVDLDIKALQKEGEKEREALKIEALKGGRPEVTDTLMFGFDTPLRSVNQDMVRLEKMEKDSTWTRVPVALQQASEFEPLRYVLPVALEPEGDYRLTIDSLAITNIYGVQNDSTVYKYKVKSLDEYGYVILHVNSGDSAYVELLDASERVVRHQRVSGGTVKFDNIAPGEYFARLVLDANGNDRWDAGSYAEHRQPEAVFYYPFANKLKVRKSWGREETWDIYATDINLQKPDRIKRNKPEKRKDVLEKKQSQSDNESTDDDEFNSTGFGRNTYSGNKYRDYQNNNQR